MVSTRRDWTIFKANLTGGTGDDEVKYASRHTFLDVIVLISPSIDGLNRMVFNLPNISYNDRTVEHSLD